MINTRIIEIDPRELKLLKMNARFMRHEEFQRLVANIKRDGQLTSAPFAALRMASALAKSTVGRGGPAACDAWACRKK